MAGSGDRWYQDAVFYEVSVRTFQDGNGDGLGDFIGLRRRLDYLQDLGVDCLWLLPMYPSPLRDDGYDISDYTGIHPDLGTLDDFRAFMADAKERGLRVIADLVLNHTSDQHPWFQAARSSRESRFRDYYVWSDTPEQYAGTRIIFTDTETSNWTWDPVAGQFFWHRFFSHQPDLNYDHVEVRERMLEVFAFWMDEGLDGFRADAIPYLIEREGTTCENLPETHAYLRELRAFMDVRYPGAILLGEANQWPEDVRAYFGAGDELHMSFHFPIMPRLYMAVRQHDRTPIAWILHQTPDIPDSCQWATFLRNHDELTLEMVTDEERATMYREYAPLPRMKINVGIRRRLWPLLEGDRRQVELMHGLLLALPGSPVLYYGDELGMGDNIWLPDRMGVRTPMQWSDDRNAGFSTAPPSRLYTPVIRDPGYHYVGVNADVARREPHSFHHWLKRLLAVRKRHRVFGRGGFVDVSPETRAIYAFAREWQGETVLAVFNLSDAAQATSLDLGAWPDMHPRELLGGARFPETSGSWPVTLAPYGFHWFVLER